MNREQRRTQAKQGGNQGYSEVCVGSISNAGKSIITDLHLFVTWGKDGREILGIGRDSGALAMVYVEDVERILKIARS